MTAIFASCSGCARHIKTTEQACPFCGKSAHAGVARGLSGAALVIAGAALIGACAKEPVVEPIRPSAAVYGGPPVMVDDAAAPSTGDAGAVPAKK